MRLTATGIVKRFGGVTALDGVDLELAEGEVLGLIGPNGSGKTTLVNCISGMMDTDDGEVSLAGERLTGSSPVRRARRGVARTFQTPRLFGQLTVGENVEIGASSLEGSRAEATELIDRLNNRLGLDEIRREVVSKLPYGYQRRVEIARALAGRPSVLLLDEPAAGLNDGETTELLALLREVRERFSCSLVVIDHDMALVMEASDRVEVLDEGKVIFVGQPDDAFKQPHVVEAYLGTED